MELTHDASPDNAGTGPAVELSEDSPYQFSSTSPLSARRQRPFVAQNGYPTKAAAQAVLQVAKIILPAVESAYRPSGKLPFMALAAMLLALPFVVLLTLGIAAIPVYIFESFFDPALLKYSNGSWAVAIIGLLVDFLAGLTILLLPGWLLARIGRLFKNRNPNWPAILTLIPAFIAGIVFFWPIWDGQSIAPVEIAFLFIPISWLLILVGGLIVPILAALSAASSVAQYKFCEKAGVFLKPRRRSRFGFDWIEDVKELVSSGEYKYLREVEAAGKQDEKNRHYAQLVLWWHERADTAFIELTAFFGGQVWPSKKGERKEVSASWLVLSKQIDRVEAEAYLAHLMGKQQ